MPSDPTRATLSMPRATHALLRELQHTVRVPSLSGLVGLAARALSTPEGIALLRKTWVAEATGPLAPGVTEVGIDELLNEGGEG